MRTGRRSRITCSPLAGIPPGQECALVAQSYAKGVTHGLESKIEGRGGGLEMGGGDDGGGLLLSYFCSLLSE